MGGKTGRVGNKAKCVSETKRTNGWGVHWMRMNNFIVDLEQDRRGGGVRFSDLGSTQGLKK